MPNLSPTATKFRSATQEVLYVIAASDPTVNDDRNERFIIGSRWINEVTDEEYVCVDNTPTVAIWKGTTSGGTSGGGGTGGGANYFGGSGGGSNAHIDIVAPTVASDTTLGYTIGQMWVDTVAQAVYTAMDVTTGAAIWKDLTAGGSGGGGTAATTTADASTVLAGTTVQSQLDTVSSMLGGAFGIIRAVMLFGIGYEVLAMPQPRVIVDYYATPVDLTTIIPAAPRVIIGYNAIV